MESQPQPDQQPISVRDVLWAIFLPPRDESFGDRIGSSPRPNLKLPFTDLGGEALPYSMPADLDQAAVIHYEDALIEPIEQATPARLATIGIGVVVAILISYLASSAMSAGKGGFGSALLVLMAAVVWLGLLMFEIAPPDGGLLRRGPTVIGGGAARPLLVLPEVQLSIRAIMSGLAFLLSISTYIFTGNNTFSALGFFSWVLSIVLWMITLSERSPEVLIADAQDWFADVPTRTHNWTRLNLIPLVAFVAIIGVSIFFRVYRLDSVPKDMTSDHVEKVLDAYDVSLGNFHVFFPHNGGREALQFYFIPLVAVIFRTGFTFISLKIASVLEGLALIPLMIWLGREVIDSETGFFGAALLSISWWHTMLSRLALRIVLTPLVFTPILITLIRGIRTGARKWWLWAGFWMGVGMYAYQSLRITPLVAIIAFVIAVAGPIIRAVVARVRKQMDAPTLQVVATNTITRQSLNLLCSGIVVIAVFMPMLRFWHDDPGDLWNRVVNRMTSSEVPIQGSPTEVLFENYIKALGMFNVKGDTSWFSAVPNAPMFDAITGAMFILGIIAWLVRLRVRRDPVDIFLISAGLVMLLPSALAIAFPIENPSTTRASAVIPIVFLVAAWPLALIHQRWGAVLGIRTGSLLAGVLTLLLLAGAALSNYHRYFVEYDDSYRHGAMNPGEVARAVRDVIGPNGSMKGVWLQGWPFWHDYRAIGIEAGDITFQNAIIDVPTLETYLTNLSDKFDVRPLIFIVNPEDVEALSILKQHFPTGKPHSYHSQTEGRDFILFIVPAD